MSEKNEHGCEDDCQRCSGEYCETHLLEPCDCGTAERHYVPLPSIDEIARTFTLRMSRAARNPTCFDHYRGAESALVELIRRVVRDMKQEIIEP